MKKLFISFSARENGNCDSIAHFLSGEQDAVVYFRDKKYHACAGCDYECFDGRCKYRGDDVYELFDSMQQYQKIIFIVPIGYAITNAIRQFRRRDKKAGKCQSTVID